MKKYNEELERMRLDIEHKRNKQAELQQDILNAQAAAAEIKGKLAGQKESVALKAQALAKMQMLVDQQRDQYDELMEEHKANIKDLVSTFSSLTYRWMKQRTNEKY